MPFYLALGFTQGFCLAVVGMTTPQFLSSFDAGSEVLSQVERRSRRIPFVMSSEAETSGLYALLILQIITEVSPNAG